MYIPSAALTQKYLYNICIFSVLTHFFFVKYFLLNQHLINSFLFSILNGLLTILLCTYTHFILFHLYILIFGTIYLCDYNIIIIHSQYTL